MERIKKFFWLVLAAVPVAIHHKYLAPALFNHGSSSAFDAAIELYIIKLTIVFWAWAVLENK